ncbi:MAG: hypothetical protein QOF62_1041 [Pyrinomonadaceae bacterium]|jgi:disulfide bond formation protein DsbB|nr:hypothetical protein [Pyrinomonadaceae bacterium]
MSDQKDIVLKSWDTYQTLIASLGDACWKIRSVYYTASFGLIAASFSSNLRALYLLVPVLAVLFGILEAGYQQIQEQYIQKNTDIERSINEMLANEQNVYLPNDGISTGLERASARRVLHMLRPGKYLFWLSYVAVILFSLILFALNVTERKYNPAPRCPASCCPCGPATPQT